MASKYCLFLFVFISFSSALSSKFKYNEDLLSSIEDTIEKKFGEYASSLTGWLKAVNDRNLLNSDAGRMLHSKELVSKIEKAGNAVEGRSMKKMSSLLPVIFQLGMTSAWMLVTTLLTAKGVAIGLTLLVLKIAVGSAKLASFFTALKNNNHQPHYEYVPHQEHHGHKRSLRSVESHVAHQDWHGYSPEYSQSYSPYANYEGASSPHVSTHEAPSPYSSTQEASSPYYAQAYEEYEHSTDTKKAQDKKYG